jgi:putative aldouronate transport system permease protein
MQATRGEKIFYSINYVIIGLLSLSTLLPFIYLFALSFSGNQAIITGKVSFFPVDFTADAYRFVLTIGRFAKAFRNSIFITAMGTFFSIVITVLTAYPLSKPNLRGRKGFLLFYIITMLFSGGLVPSFLLVKSVGIYNTIWALTIPGMLSVFNMLLIKNFIEGLPEAIEESAKIDGANSAQILFSIILPLITPAVATVALFYAVGYWNSYFPGMMYISDPDLKPLQTYLYEVVRMASVPAHELPADVAISNVTAQSVQAATILASIAPILIVYPYLQKYFVKGLVIGSVK